jgi:hypothetical protein
MRSERPLLRLTPRVRRKSWKYDVVAPLVMMIIGPFVLAYKLLVGWWLNPILDERYEKKFREQIRTDLAFLFDDFDGHFVVNDLTHKNVALVMMEAANLRIMISQHHGDYGISVARRDSANSAESLYSILTAIYEREGSLRTATYVNLEDLGRLFREKFNEVQTALSDERYSDTVAAISRRHQQGMQRMVQAFNRPDGRFDADLVDPSDLAKKVSR